MKLNNKGFAISSIMYIILVLAVILISLILVTLSSRKLILDKLKDEVLTTIYEAPNITYRQTIKQLKNETIAYMATNSLEKDSIKVESLDSSIDNEVLEKYKLNDKYLTAVQNTDSYDVYLGKASTINNTTELPKNTIDIVDYKIYGNSYQETSVQGKNLFSISNRTLGTFASDSSNTSVRKFEFNKYYVGLSNNNYYYLSNVTSYSISGESVTINSNLSGYGIGIPIKVKSNTTYSISAITEETIGIGFYTSSGEYISDTYSATFTTPENCEIITVVLRPQINVDATYTNIQLEEGNKATEYEEFIPNKPSIEYPSEVLSVGNKNKNLFDKNTIEDNTRLAWGSAEDSVDHFASDYIDCENIDVVTINLAGSFVWYDKNKNVISYENKSATIFRNYVKPAGAKYLRLDFLKSAVSPEDVICLSGEYTLDTLNYFKYKIPVKTGSKNLINRFNYPETTTISGITFTNNGDGTFTLNGTATEDVSLQLVKNVSVGSGVNAYISGAPEGSSTTTYSLETSYWNAFGETGRTIQSNTGALSIEVKSGITVKDLVFKPQVELGTTRTEYEPYVEPVTTNIYLDEPLAKIEKNVDYASFINQNIVREIGLKQFDGSEAIGKHPTSLSNPNGINTYLYYDINGEYLDDKFDENMPIMSTHYRSLLNSSVSTVTESGAKLSRPSADRRVLYIADEALDVASFKNFLLNEYEQGTPVTFYYQLASGLEKATKLPKISTNIGATQISIDTDVLPSKYEFTVVQKIIEI